MMTAKRELIYTHNLTLARLPISSNYRDLKSIYYSAEYQ